MTFATDAVTARLKVVRQPRVYSIGPDASFLETLVAALLAGELVPGPIDLSTTTIYVPTRRAASALSQVFMRLAAVSTFLPRIMPLGALGEESDSLIDDEWVSGVLFDEPLLPAIGNIERRMILSRMILEWARAVRHAIRSVDSTGRRQTDESETLLVATSPVDAFCLSSDLARLIDELIIEDVAWEKLKPLCLSSFDDYWRITLDFLDIAMSSWPQLLSERASIDRARRQIALLEREIAKLEHRGGAIIAAGSTGTNKATARLMAAIARAPNGAVVLPGLDADLDQRSWQLIGQTGPGTDACATHPQAALRRLLPILGINRDDVTPIGAPPSARLRFVNEAMRPATATATWRGFIDREGTATVAAALNDILVIEAADEREEALAMAIALREVLQTPGKTAALITPDRALAERVRVELKRWDINIEDSGGSPLTRTAAGAFARLILTYAAARSAANLLALVAHPLTRLGLAGTANIRLLEAFEIGILRPMVPLQNWENVRLLVDTARALAGDPHAHPSQRRVSAETWAALEDYLQRLGDALHPLQSISGRASLAHWLALHRLVFSNLCSTPPDHGQTAVSGLSEITVLFDLLEESSAPGLEVDIVEYAALFEAAARETRVRHRTSAHPRLAILGLLEARLLRFDVALLGGLDETIWPPQTDCDAFLNRPMRLQLGLTPPERRIGQTAHDFVALLGSPKVFISRALKRAGTPTVASRFVQRLAALAGEPLWAARRAAGDIYLSLARLIDAPMATRRAKRPEPRPPVELRPTALSVTRIETLRRDPYSIFAEKILRVVPLEPIGATPGAREVGTLLHSLVAELVREFPSGQLPENAFNALLSAARGQFAPLLTDAAFRAFRWPVIARTLRAFINWENGRRLASRAIFVEERGELDISLRNGSSFRLSATADRLELLSNGGVAVIDFKTGSPPSNREIIAGFAPQLTLEAAMAKRGAFASLPKVTETEGLYIKLLKCDLLQEVRIGDAHHSFDTLVEDHFSGLTQLLDEFCELSTAYVPRPYPQFASRFAPYDHLARVKEWSATGGLADSDGSDG